MPVYPIDDPEFWNRAPAAHEDARTSAVAAGWQAAVFGMGDDENADDIPVVALLFIPPGQILPRHTHDCHRVEIMLQGTLDVGDRILRPGDVSTSGPGEFYGPHTAGATGSLSIEIFSRASGMKSRTPGGGRVQIVSASAPS